jgi:predicted dehydrogenase
MKKLRYGIVGGGFIAGFQLRALCEVPGIEVVGFVSKDPVDHLIRFATVNGLGEPKAFSSVTEMAKHVDVVAIWAPNFVRLAIVEELVAAIKAGAEVKAVICEKPLARNMAEARRMLSLIHSVPVLDVYFENQLHMKALNAQRAQLGPLAKSMGPMSLVRSSEEHAGPHSAWFWDPTCQGGGVMSDMGCHCLAVGWYALTPPDKPVRYLEPVSVSADLALLKWGQPRWRKDLLDRLGVDYAKVPAEDFATGMVTYRHPDSGQLAKAQFTVSWMYDKQGLRLLMDGLGPGYGFEMNSLRSPLEVFIGDVASDSLADTELALEKQQASRGLLTIQPNEADLYGYTDENRDVVAALAQGRPTLLNWEYGAEITRLTMAAYMSSERRCTIDLTDPAVAAELETYVPMIQQGRGKEILL